MIVEGTYEFPAPRATVYDLLQDPQVLVKALPGARTLTQTGDGRYEGVMSVGVGPVSAAAFDVRVELLDRVPPERFSMRIDGKGPIGFTRGSADVTLSETNGTTTMQYRADLQVGGRIAGVGQRLLDSTSRMMTRQALEALNRELQSRFAPQVADAAVAVQERRRIWTRRIIIYSIVELIIIAGVLYFFVIR
jgi:carbon monoxide dehydrogenase subunit G